MLDCGAGFSAALLGLKPVAVSPTASKPELSTGISCGVVVPLHHVVPAGSWIQGLAASLGWRQTMQTSIKQEVLSVMLDVDGDSLLCEVEVQRT